MLIFPFDDSTWRDLINSLKQGQHLEFTYINGKTIRGEVIASYHTMRGDTYRVAVRLSDGKAINLRTSVPECVLSRLEVIE